MAVKRPDIGSEEAGKSGTTKWISPYNREIRGASHVKDHEGQQINIVWHPKAPYKKWGTIPPFPYQVYLTKNAREAVKDESFQEKFATFIDGMLGKFPDCQYRLEIYQRPFANVLACIAHQRREVEWRHRNAIWPQIVRRWTTEDGAGYIGKIIVIDSDEWKKEGIDFVYFDPVEYESPEKFEKWDYAGVGDVSVARSFRSWVQPHIERWLSLWWRNAGFKWTEADLERRNNGGYSPVLYPAIDPDAHRDVEEEDAVEFEDSALNAISIEEIEEGNDGPPKIKGTFNKKQLYRPTDDFPSYRMESYSDTFGLPVTSVWDQARSKLRPGYSLTLYLSFDIPSIHPKAIFSCLNQGLIAREAWTLDIVHNMPGKDFALDYHTRSSRQRSLAKTISTRRCIHMIVHKIAGGRLPDELQEYVRDLLSPPEIPDYSSRSSRPYSAFFMYLDAKTLPSGPQLVYFNPKPFSNTHTPTGLVELLPLDDSRDWASMCAEEPFQMRSLRFWNRVADELHILWSMSSARAPMPDGISLPHMTVKLVIPEVWSRTTFKDHENPKVLISMDLHSSLPIIVHHNQPSSHTLCGDAFEIMDLETGKVLPELPHRTFGINSCFDSWS